MSTHIDINNDHELYIWARMLGVGPDELVRLVGEVGPTAERVREALKRSELSRIGSRRPPDRKT